LNRLKVISVSKIVPDDLTYAGKTITGVSSITGTIEAVRYVGTSSKLTASSVVLSAFIHIYVSCQVSMSSASSYLFSENNTKEYNQSQINQYNRKAAREAQNSLTGRLCNY